MTRPVLSISNLRTELRQGGRWFPVIEGVSFDIGRGETVAVVGESGAGKSVTAMSTMQLLPPEISRLSGSIRLDGRELLGLGEAEMSAIRGNQMAMIFQEPMTHLNPVLSIGAQITESLVRHRGMDQQAARAEAVRLLERVHIPAAAERLDAYPHKFSGGMRQRVMIAMALACKPQLLIADEPTTALDVTVQAQILQLIKELQDETGMAVLFITHDMGVVAEVADKTVVMLKGEVVETGETARLFCHQQHPYTRALLSVVPRLGSMAGEDRPLRFPVVNGATQAIEPPRPTVAPVPRDEAPVLEVRNLTTRFDMRAGVLRRVVGRVHAVEDVSFVLRPGETLALVGESGCGKSTIGKSVMRLIRHTSGHVLVNGADIAGLRGEALRQMRRNVQMVFQDPMASLNPRRTIGRAIAAPYLAHGLGTRRQADELVADLLQRVGLSPDMAGRYPHEFSGGQRQRICIARALALNPGVIVADESVSALDVSIKAQIVNLLMDLQESLRLAYLFISHDMAVVERVSHRVIVMYLGEIVEYGTRAQIFGNPQHPYTRKLIAAVPLPDPGRRRDRRPMPYDEIKSPIRPPDYVAPARRYDEVAPGHFVQTA